MIAVAEFNPDHFLSDPDLDIEIFLGLYQGFADETAADFAIMRRLFDAPRGDHGARAFCGNREGRL